MKEINHEYYVSLEVAKLLKEAGFDWEICGGYIIYEDGDGFSTGFQIPYNFNGDNGDLFINYRGHKEILSKPTLDVAQRWLREVKRIDVIVNRNFPIHEPQYSWEYEYVIIASDGRVEAVDCYFEEYEQAQEAGIKKALEMILEKEE